ncbi:MAG: bifunctional oligoribonuclease/PAP phosphatase NrnA [Acidobacteria bacterium]|nr:bifunctional oligoribonuclease/PAP phosphatase NrnA [Acidobacteriota bacterium]MBU4254064.1 bifunctional oligoribonuclease/PAP phosphatase NrnA [Acidobacteriota bacterium]MBU4329002.1 bifunctional oligoribonuclease/PAP phosphatase NrnA [Acidobacteriota bacterium]MBU4495400.1 bifunctional oligoribonuclease/PAP phosphatase NrnA [Acidobacteriota bacterium]MCG2815072.1 bifunctional oligoribonuclease/PAP phosphatase NrnA [Candidatus Aminicenantes bacterium]
MNSAIIQAVVDKIKSSDRIVLASHLRPDGDSLCTSIALSMMLRSMGKEADIINFDNTPFPFIHFEDIGMVQIGTIPQNFYDLAILLECANVSRSGHDTLQNTPIINIDHHHSNDYYADINWVEPEAPAVACLAYKLVIALGVTLTSEMANHLYCGIVSDTGSFQFSNTNAQAFEVCHHLVKKGADPVKVSAQLFRNNPPEKIILLGRVLSSLRLNDEGNIAVISMFKKDLESLNLQKEIDTEDIMTLVRSIKNVDMVLFFKEMKPDTYRVSLRSRGEANSARVAEYFEGGGHLHAAGFTVIGPFDQLMRDVPRTVSELIRKKPACGNAE